METSTCGRLETNGFNELISCTHPHRPRDKTELGPTEPSLTGLEGGSHFGITEEEPAGILSSKPLLGERVGEGRTELVEFDNSACYRTLSLVRAPVPLSQVETSSSLEDPARWPTVCPLTLETPLLSVLPGKKPGREQWPLAFSGRFCPPTRHGEATGSHVWNRGLNLSDAVDKTKSGHLTQRGPLGGPFSWKLAIITKIVSPRHGLVFYKEKQKKCMGND